jgi:hypothetical protein
MPSRIDGIAIKIVEMRNPIPIAMLSILFMIRDRVVKMTDVVALIDAANPVSAFGDLTKDETVRTDLTAFTTALQG